MILTTMGIEYYSSVPSVHGPHGDMCTGGTPLRTEYMYNTHHDLLQLELDASLPNK